MSLEILDRRRHFIAGAHFNSIGDKIRTVLVCKGIIELNAFEAMAEAV
jgi:hypothetical protein